MNSLRYMTLEAAAPLAALEALENGTVVVAHAAAIETTERAAAVLAIERNAGDHDWKRVWNSGVYHYELLVARDGITPMLDANGEECGFAVNGTNKARY